MEGSQGGKPFVKGVIITDGYMVWFLLFITLRLITSGSKPWFRKDADLDIIPWGIDTELSINGQVPVKESKKHVPLVCNVQ